MPLGNPFSGNLVPEFRRSAVDSLRTLLASFLRSNGSVCFFAESLWSTLAFLVCLAFATPSLTAQVLTDHFDYPAGEINQVSGGTWAVQTAGTPLFVTNGEAIINQGDLTTGQERVSRAFSTVFAPGTSNSVVYFSFNATWQALPLTTSGSYFVHLSTATNGTVFYGRVGASTDGAADGFFRVSVANANWSQANTVEFPQDLALNVSYNLVVKYDLNTGNTTLWLNPGSEASLSVTATDPPAGAQQSISAISLRQGLSNSSSGAPGVIEIDDLLAGSSFSQVVVSSPPLITQQPASVSVAEGQTASFIVGLKNPGNVSTQWRRNGVPIVGATNTTLVYGPVTTGDQNARFNAILSNGFGLTNTTTAVLTVIPDTTPPVLLGAANLDAITVVLSFSEPLAAAGATNASNYSIGGAAVQSAAFGPDASSIWLTVSPLARGSNYVVVVSGVTDRASAANPIAPGSQAGFVASDLVPVAIGSAGAGDGVQPLADGGYSITSSGAGSSGANDQFQFAWQQRVGDFDQKVRVEGVSLTDVWAQAGLMARDKLTVNSRYAAVLATPSVSGTFFETRSAEGSAAGMSGSYPVNYPYTWLRLQRAGNVFTGFASYDGDHWVVLGTTTLPLPNAIYVGPVAAGHQPGKQTAARFHDLRPASGGIFEAAPLLPFEPLSASSRKTGIVISEIMFNPASRADGRNGEYIELFNSNPWPEDISGYALAGDMAYKFPQGTVMPAGGFLLVARSPADFQAIYGLPGALGPFVSPVPTTGVVQLLNDGTRPAVYLEVPYGSLQPWTGAADGTGHSLVLKKPSYGEGFLEAWGVSEVLGGSPGAMDGYRPHAARHVVINEVAAHVSSGQSAFVEFYNHDSASADLSGCLLTDFPGTNRFIVPAGTVLGGAGFVSFSEIELGFAPDPNGGALYLETPDGQQIIDVIRYNAQELGVSSGRSPDGSAGFVRLKSLTPGAANGPMADSDIVINEIMFKPLSGLKDDQFVELYNQGATPVDLGGWKLNHGVTFTFPTGTVIAPKGFVVAAKNASRMLTNYPNLSSSITLGNFGGSLSGGGERLTLSRPMPFVTVGKKGQLNTNINDVPVEDIAYGVGGRWGQWSDAGGGSMELRDPRSDRRLAANWADSDESGKATWTTIAATNHLDLGATQGGTPIDRVEILLSGAGECLVDNVEVIEINSATNRLSDQNSNFESGLGGWVATGDHIQSSLETSGGFGGGQCLHVRATDRGDTMVNHLRVPLTRALSSGQTVIMRLKVRWLRGFPELVFRVKGNFAEATSAFNLPTGFGTPGAANTQAATNVGPAIVDVGHWPVVPAGGQPVVVSARVSDPDGVSQVVARYRQDPSSAYTDLPLKDDGTGGDLIAGDGIYSGTIPGFPSGTLVAFYINAVDNSPGRVSAQFPAAAPDKECLVRFGDPIRNSAFSAYHMWVTQAKADLWTAQQSISNERHDLTFVYGQWRAIYNVQGKFAGSPYHQGFGSPIDNSCHYSLEMPGDDQFLGATSFNKIHAPGNGPWDDDTLQREQTAYWMARQLGLPWNYRRYVNVFINGNQRQPSALMEDTQTPDADVVGEHFPNDKDGDLFKLQPWFEFADNGQTFDNQGWCTLNNYLSGGQKKRARYRPNFLVRAAKQTANDYSGVFQLIDTAHLPVGSAAQRATYISSMNALVDTDEWLRTTAVQHGVGNWDSFLNSNGQNMYAYKPQNGPWTLYTWDFNIVLGAGSDGPTGDDLFKVTGGDSGAMNQFSTTPQFRRSLWRAYWELANRIMVATNVNPILDSRFAMFQVEGVAANAPTAVKSWIKSRQTYLLSQLKNIDVPFAITPSTATNFSTDQNPVVLTGTAPMTVEDIEIDGTVYPVTWVDFRHWQLNLPLAAATNRYSIQGVDRLGQVASTNTATVQIIYTGTLEPLAHQVVVNEIMYHSPTAGAEFVELFNSATNTPYDLSGWRIDGLGYTFPAGATLSPGGYLVLANDRQVFAEAYGAVPVSDVFAGFPDLNGGLIRLVKPGITAADDFIVNAVRFRSSAPWPSSAAGAGASLQLIDSKQDNFRPANWAASDPGAAELATPGRANTFNASLPVFPNLFINEVFPENTSILDNFGDFDPLIEIYNAGSVGQDLSGFSLAGNYTNNSVWSFPSGSTIGAGEFIQVWSDGQPEQSAPGVLHTSFRLSPGKGSVVLSSTNGAVLDYLDYDFLSPGRSYGSYPDGQSIQRQRFYYPTIGRTNNPAPGPHPVLINEWMASNSKTIVNPATGLADDWFELYNAADSAVDLSGFALASPASSTPRFIIPAGTSFPGHGWLLVWADKQPTSNAPGTPLHTSFHLNKKGTDIALFAPDGTVVDIVSFGAQSADISEGRAPDGADAPFAFYSNSTPGAANIARTLVAQFDWNRGQVHLQFLTQPGLHYQVVYKDSLTAPWEPLSEFTASAASAEVIDTIPGGDQRYYQFVVETGN